MKIFRSFFLPLLFSIAAVHGFGQSKSSAHQNEKLKIGATIKGFLNWRREQEKQGEGDVFVPIKGGPPDTTTQTRIDMAQVEKYIADLRKTGFFSENLFNYLRGYYREIDERLAKEPLSKSTDLVLIHGFEMEILLHTFDTSDILDHIKNGRLDRCYIIYDKAIARFTISPYIKMLFTLTRVNKRWLIDYIGYDNTSVNGIGRQ